MSGSGLKARMDIASVPSAALVVGFAVNLKSASAGRDIVEQRGLLRRNACLSSAVASTASRQGARPPCRFRGRLGSEPRGPAARDAREDLRREAVRSRRPAASYGTRQGRHEQGCGRAAWSGGGVTGPASMVANEGRRVHWSLGSRRIAWSAVTNCARGMLS